jgi:hypothetical protein
MKLKNCLQGIGPNLGYAALADNRKAAHRHHYRHNIYDE